MLEGLYTAAAGMAAQQQRMDALSNDVANANTDGYKHVRVGFRDLVYQADGAGGVRTGAGAVATEVGRGFSQGSLRKTDQPFDLAIAGDGYFQVRTSSGQVGLTRTGSFSPDARGQLVAADGSRLMPPIQIPAGTDLKHVTVGPTGQVSAGGRVLGQITVVTVPSPTALIPAGNNLFTPSAASGAPRRAVGATIQQGALEASDVNLADSMVDIMDSQRSYAMASKAISMQDQMMQIANGVKA